MTLSDILRAINKKTDDQNLVNEWNSSEYPPFVINRIMSNFPDTLFIASNMNKMPRLDPSLQFRYFFYAVPRRNRFQPLIKKKTEEDVKFAAALAEEYGISKKSALKYLGLRG